MPGGRTLTPQIIGARRRPETVRISYNIGKISEGDLCMSLNAYKSVQKIAETPRATEHRLVRQITGEMIEARDVGAQGTALMAPLHRNREMWTVFMADCRSAANGLPAELRAGILSIGMWVDRHTSAVMAGDESIDDLIDVNRTIMDGLLASEQRAAA